MKIEIEVPKGYKAEWVNGILTLVQDKKEDIRPVTERVKTFDDAVAELGEDNNLVMMFKHFETEGFAAGSEDLIAYLKLRIIAAALNEGWTPQFTDDECRYHPWFQLYNKECWNNLSEDDKRQHGVVFGGYVTDGANADFDFAYLTWAPSVAGVYFGSRICFKSKELALYAGKQFASLWLDLCYLPHIGVQPYINK